jgi:chaperonin GroES
MIKGTQIKPLFNYVLVKPLEEEAKTPSGIVLPESAKEKPQVGEIMAVGPGKKEKGHEEKIVVKKGEKVLYKKWGGNEIKVGTQEWLLVEQKDIMAVIK